MSDGPSMLDEQKPQESGQIQYERFFAAARAAGCPRDQVENFLRAGIGLQPGQLSMAAASRLCDKDGGPVSIGVGGSRGGGKSHWMISQLAADDCQRFPGLKCLWLRREGKANREHLNDLRLTTLKGVPHRYASQEGLLKFHNGSRIVCGHFQNENDIDSYLGIEYDIIAIEEATELQESRYTNIRTCLRSSKPGWRPRDYSTSNPGGIGHAWYKNRFILPFRRKQETVTRFVPSLCQDNIFNNSDYIKILEGLPGWKRRAWLEGDWDIQAGQYFSTWRESVHVLEHWDDRKAVIWFAALDYGWSHYTTIILYAVTGDGKIVAVEEHGERKAVPAWHVQEFRKIMAKHGMTDFSRLQFFVAGSDIFATESDGASVAAAYGDLGMPLTCAEMDRVNGWSEVLRRLGDPDNGHPPSLLVTRKCPKLIEQIPCMAHDPHRPEDVLKVDVDENGNGGDDFADNLRMACLSYKGSSPLVRAIPLGRMESAGSTA